MGCDEISEAALVHGVLNGDEAAFVALYRRYQRDVLRFCYALGRSTSLAEDVSQEVFLSLFQRAQSYEPAKGSVRAWLLGAARHLMLERLRRQARLTAELPVDALAIEADGERDFALGQALGQLHRAILALAPAYRDAIVLCELQELSYAEAALVIGCPIGTVRSRLHRGRALLAAELAGGDTPADAESELCTEVRG